MSQNLDRLKEAFASWHDKKGSAEAIDKWMSLFGETCRFHSLGDDQSELTFIKAAQSKAEVRAFFEGLTSALKMVHYTTWFFVEQDDRIAVLGNTGWRNPGTGAVAEKSQIVVTALHCVRDRQSVGVEFSNGEERTAWVVATDEIADQAVLFLEEPVWVTPLRIARLRSVPGSMLYFGGHPDRLGFQSARHYGVEIVKNLMVDAKTTSRWYFVIAMGRKAGHLALGIGKAAGATLTLISEEFTPPIRLQTVVDTLAGAIIKRLSEGRRDGVRGDRRIESCPAVLLRAHARGSIDEYPDASLRRAIHYNGSGAVRDGEKEQQQHREECRGCNSLNALTARAPALRPARRQLDGLFPHPLIEAERLWRLDVQQREIAMRRIEKVVRLPGHDHRRDA